MAFSNVRAPPYDEARPTAAATATHLNDERPIRDPSPTIVIMPKEYLQLLFRFPRPPFSPLNVVVPYNTFMYAGGPSGIPHSVRQQKVNWIPSRRRRPARVPVVSSSGTRHPVVPTKHWANIYHTRASPSSSPADYISYSTTTWRNPSLTFLLLPPFAPLQIP